MKGFKKMEINYIHGSDLISAPWRSTYVLKPDQKILVSSLRNFGWVAPILVQEKSGMIIDGHERWMIAANDSVIQDRDSGMIPANVVDCSDIEAMVMHVKVNRARGIMHAKALRGTILKILRSKAYTEDELRVEFGMTRDEMMLFSGASFLKGRKISEHKYSKAWVPIEAPPGAAAPSVKIEKPPNADR